MASVEYWTIELKNQIELRLIVDGKDVAEEFQEKEIGAKCIEKRITGIVPQTSNYGYLQINMGKFWVQLAKEKFKATSLFGVEIRSADDLLTCWQDICDFLENEYRESKKRTNFTPDESEETIVNIRNFKETNQSPSHSNDIEDVEETNHSTNLSNDDDLQDNAYEHENQERMTRNQLLAAIARKKAAYKFLDIFSLHDPPMKYRVRKINQDFVDKLADTMVEKKSVSLHNAPNVIGLIEINIEEYKEEDFETYRVYIIDGNHSIKAQREAYRRTQDSLFKFRSVNIYCGLSENESLLLGISRNEDTEKFVKFGDHQKVEILRTRLYTMTNTPGTMEPPKPPKEFKEIFASFLNLQTKKAIDSKSILRFLATGLSKRNYRIYQEINNRGTFPASKFEFIKGLQEEDVFNCLKMLSSTNLQKEDWQHFSSICQQKQKNPKKLRKDVTITFNFHEKTTQATVSNKPINGNLACYRFIQGHTEVLLSNAEFRDLIFGFHNKEACFEEEWSPQSVKPYKGHAGLRNAFPRSRTSFDENLINVPFKGRNASKKVFSDMPIKTLSPSKLKPNIIKRHFVDTEETDTDTDDQGSCSNSSNTHLESRSADHSLSAGQMCSTSNEIAPEQSNDISLSAAVSSFLYKMADFDAARRAESRLYVIEEDEIETMPENLIDSVHVLLNLNVQKAAKQYFSPDAWQCVQSTLTVLEGRFLQKTQQKEYLDPSCSVGKGKNLVGQAKGRFFMNKRPHNKEKIKNYVRKYMKECCSTPIKGSNTGSRGIYSFSSEDLSPIKLKKGNHNPQRDSQTKKISQEDNKTRNIQMENPSAETENEVNDVCNKDMNINLKRKLSSENQDARTSAANLKNQGKNKSGNPDKYVVDDFSPRFKCKIRLTDISTVKNWRQYDAKKS